jgi:hypothetical protein
MVLHVGSVVQVLHVSPEVVVRPNNRSKKLGFSQLQGCDACIAFRGTTTGRATSVGSAVGMNFGACGGITGFFSAAVGLVLVADADEGGTFAAGGTIKIGSVSGGAAPLAGDGRTMFGAGGIGAATSGGTAVADEGGAIFGADCLAASGALLAVAGAAGTVIGAGAVICGLTELGAGFCSGAGAVFAGTGGMF